ncbi:MAG: metal ABC transporter substrate-binding protein [Xanthobacteraceae bacterium]|nr:metal ABC transporter substrate-binding protein [Xanthobacteraceae bacterium]
MVTLVVSFAVAFSAAAQAPLLVVATTTDLKSIAERVSGGTARVETLIPPGADPETFEPRPSHLATLRRAGLVLRVGAGYEHWLDRLLQQAGSTKLLPGGEGYLDLSSQIALLEVRGRSVTVVPGHAHGSANPHYWLDPANAEIISREISSALVRLMPDQRATIEAAHANFVAELRDRLRVWSKMLEPHQGVPLAAYHNTWPYFARRFRLNIVDVIEQKEGVAPSLARLGSLASTLRARGVRVILHEPFQPIATSRVLAQRLGAEVIVLAPSVGGVPEAKDYLSLLDFNVKVLAKALTP